MSVTIDDKTEHCVPFILKRIKAHRESYKQAGKEVQPFFLGLNGVQGAGKTTLVSSLYTILTAVLNVPTVVLSLDDLYLTHSAQKSLSASHPSNPLIQHRGQPSTHDIPLGSSLFTSLASKSPNIHVPAYDKSAHHGQGDRADQSTWQVVNKPGEPAIEVVVFEGWSVGFRALDDADLERKWEIAKEDLRTRGEEYKGQLARLELQDLKFVNQALREYDVLTDRFAAFIHIDAEDTQFVYDWRLQQEAALRKAKGTGMTDQQVIEFVNGYYSAYELYTDVLRKGIFPEPGNQLRLVVDQSRCVKEVHEI